MTEKSKMYQSCIFTLLWVLGLFGGLPASAARHCEIVVDKNIAMDRQANNTHPPQVTSLAAALAIIRTRACDSTRVQIAAGDYREKITLDVPNVTLAGANAATTRIVFGLYAGVAGSFHPNGWGTPGSATVTVRADNIRLENLTIGNDFDYLANDARENDDPEKIRHSQAVALWLDQGSDWVRLHSVVLAGYQDTLFADSGRLWATESTIKGNVDFIFGGGQVLIEQSDIISRPRGKAFSSGDIQGHITAPSTSIQQSYGLVLVDCRLIAEAGVASASVTLGRPWHPTRNFPDGRYADPDAIGHVLYFNTEMGDHIAAARWASMRGTARDGTKSAVFTPAQSRFREWQSRGPGAGNSLPTFVSEDQALARLQSIRKAHFQGWLGD